MSKKGTVNITVTLREAKGDVGRLIRKFMKKVKKERIIEDYLDRRFYEKPSVKKRRKRLKKLHNARKAEQERNQKLNTR